MIEGLEARRMFSGTNIDITGAGNLRGLRLTDGGTLQVFGTSRSEAILVCESAASVLGVGIVRESPFVSWDVTQIREPEFTIHCVRGDAAHLTYQSVSLTAGATASGVQAALEAIGQSDSIIIQAARRRVVDRWLIDANVVKQIVVDAGAGNDRLTNGAVVPEHAYFQSIARPVTLLGGAGDDFLMTRGNATLFGGRGTDFFEASGAYQFKLYGGAGDDDFMGNDGLSIIDGGSGHDRVHYTPAGDFSNLQSIEERFASY